MSVSSTKISERDVLKKNTIPLIDISCISLQNVDVAYKNYEIIGTRLCEALSSCGFAYLSNHGIPERTVKECVNESEKFFKLPSDVKMKYNRGIKDIHGYSWKGREILERSDLVESKESFDVSSWGPNSKFPDDEDGTSDFRIKVKCLAHQSVILARRLIRCLATDLGADPLQFLQDHSEMFTGRGNNATSIRLLHYPKIDTDLGLEAASASSAESSCVTRCGEHTDYGGLTLLYQDSKCGGLEVQTLDGDWIAATPIPNTIVLNIGDLLAFWSGGRYRATPHRVRFYGETGSLDRYSIALFVHPNSDVKLNPFESNENRKTEIKKEVDDESSLSAIDYVNKRFSETYIEKK